MVRTPDSTSQVSDRLAVLAELSLADANGSRRSAKYGNCEQATGKHAKGQGVPQDYAQAVDWYRKAAILRASRANSRGAEG